MNEKEQNQRKNQQEGKDQFISNADNVVQTAYLILKLNW
jgi:hypothetical protein